MLRRRVVVTGMGMLTPVGNTVKESWDAVLAGRSGAAMIEHFDASIHSTRFAATIKNFNVEQYMTVKDARKMDVFIQYAMAAAAQAMEDAGLDVTAENAERIGVFIGSGIGGLTLIEENHDTLLSSGPRRISPFFVPGSIINMTAGNVSIKYGIKGPNMAIATACASATHSIGYAARTIAYGDADAILAGGAEKASTALGMGGFAASRALSTRNDDPQHASRPWDKDRDGFMLGDGAGILMLEEYEHAKKRGANMYAELVGFGLSGDAYHMTSPPEDGAGAALSMKNTLKDAQVSVDQVQYINAHGTSTPIGDLAESRAVESVFGASAHKLAMSSTKSMTGHLLGAAGAIEAIFSILAIRDQVAPPTINLDHPGEGCHLNYVPHKPQAMKIEYALSNSFGFGGTNGSLLFKKI